MDGPTPGRFAANEPRRAPWRHWLSVLVDYWLSSKFYAVPRYAMCSTQHGVVEAIAAAIWLYIVCSALHLTDLSSSGLGARPEP
jgi:hypothetical protein